MYTNKPIRIHSKCLLILEMIQKVNNRIEDKRSSLHRYDNCKDYFQPIRLMNKREDFIEAVEYLKTVKERLERYYNNTLEKIIPQMQANG